jgi:lipoate-protein ligase B
MEVAWLGEVGYRQALSIQLDHVSRRADGEIGDTLLLLTHPSVYTLGSAGDPGNLLVPREELDRAGVPVERVSRGGDITWHGPGQLVGYPIVRLRRPDVLRHLRAIERSLVDALAAFGIRGERIEGLTGVWEGGRKIASIGVGVKRWVTWHGFALNVSPDLSWFRKIRLCGLEGAEATSMEEVLGHAPPMEAVREAVAEACALRLGESGA